MAQKKSVAPSVQFKRGLIEPGHRQISIRRQCELLGLNRASYYYQPAQESALNLKLMRLIDEQYTKTPFYGWPRMTVHLQRAGYPVNHKRIQRLMHLMGLQAIYPQPRAKKGSGQAHKVYPYLLRGVQVSRVDQVWATDITYIGLPSGFMYLVAIIDWYSRYVLAWQLSNTLDGAFCLVALEQALAHGKPDIFNTDQGVQFTAHQFTDTLAAADIRVSMSGAGRVWDNIFGERLWRTVKYEHVYLVDHQTVPALHNGLAYYFPFYNDERPHQSLDHQTPAEVYFG